MTLIYNNKQWVDIRCLYSYLDSLQVTILLVTVQNDVIGHTETLSHSKVIEEGRLAESVTHLHYCHICGVNLRERVSRVIGVAPRVCVIRGALRPARLHLPAL